MACCNCMVGLCEACSHVGALLFAIEAVVRMRESVTCTQEKSRWIMPSYVKEILFIPAVKWIFPLLRNGIVLWVNRDLLPQTPDRGEMSKQPQQKNRSTSSKEFQTVGSNRPFYPLLHLIMLLLYLLRTEQCQSH